MLFPVIKHSYTSLQISEIFDEEAWGAYVTISWEIYCSYIVLHGQIVILKKTKLYLMTHDDFSMQVIMKLIAI